MNIDQVRFWSHGRQSDGTGRTISVDFTGLKIHRSLWGILTGEAGYRPLLLMFAVVFLALIVLLPLPGSLVGLMEQVNPLGYDMEADTETIADSVNYHRNPDAFEAWQSSGRPASTTAGVDSSEQVARRAMIMVGILVVAALFWGTEALPISATVTLVAVLMYVFRILPAAEIPKAFMQDAVFFILRILAIAVGVSKTGLDKRIGLLLLRRINSASAVAFIFFPAIAICSAFLSAHALVALLVPVMMGIYKATCVAHGVKQDRMLAIFLFLGLTFAANAGGPGSPAAGARNAIMVGYLAEAGIPMSFSEWMKYGLPLVPVLSAAAGAYMYICTRSRSLVSKVKPSEVVRLQVAGLPGFSRSEALMTTILVLLAVAWITLNDSLGLGGATITAVFAMFLFRIVGWDDIREGVALDVVGLYAAASAMGRRPCLHRRGALACGQPYGCIPELHERGERPGHGGEHCNRLSDNFMSDGATVGALGPIALPMAELGNVSLWKVGLMLSFSSSFANVLVVGTPNNAIVFAMGRDPETGKRLLSVFDFVKYGLPLTLILLLLMWGWALFGYWSFLSWP